MSKNKASRNLLSRLALRCRGETLCTFVDEIIGLPLALGVFPEVLDFPGDAVLKLVEPGLYRKGLRVDRSAESTSSGQ